MLNLLVKDFKLIYSKNGKKHFYNYLLDLILIILLIGLETFIFHTLLNKINSFNNAPTAFLVIFLACISFLMIILNTLRAKKLFFNDLDISQLNNKPIANDEIILSKLILLLLMHYFTSLLLVYPLFISYGLLVSKSMWFYYIIVFYPFFSFLFEGGVSLLLVFPYKIFKDYLDKHIVIQFIFSIVSMIILGTIYAIILNLFMQLVSDNNLNLLFTVDNINKILKISNNLIPINFLTDIFITGNKASLIPLLSISVGIFLVGLAVSILAYSYFTNFVFYNKKKKERVLKVVSPTKELIKKEFMLLFKDENYIYSFTGLLIIEPLLMYLVVSSVNTIFNSGTYLYYLKILPNFLPLIDILLVILFTLLISSGANNYIKMEEKTMKIVKSIPISYKKQTIIKVFIPFFFSLSSLLISLVVLVSTKVISFNTFMFATIFSIVILMIFDEVSLIKELSVHQKFVLKPISFILPILAFIISVLLSMIKVNLLIIYFVTLFIYLIVMISFFIYIKKNLNQKFLELDVFN